MRKYISINKRLVIICTLMILCINNSPLFSQITIDSTLSKKDTISKTIPRKKTFEDRVNYSSKDSITIDLSLKKVFLYNESKIKYQGIELESGEMSINFKTKSLSAQGIMDSNNNMVQYPIFKEKGTEYRSTNIDYNFDTKKGYIKGVFTKEGEGYLHGEKVKKVDDKTMYISHGKFTTCDLDHPHFSINFSKAKAITQDKIITGPAWFSIMDIPLPLGIPFGYFPFTSTKQSGLLIPTYGYAQNRGYYLRNLGWYFAINDYVDLIAQGDIYTNLSWAVNLRSNYVKRYKYRGNLELRFEENKTGIKNTPSFSSSTDFKLRWTHQQDAKSNPNSNFSANVNLVSRSFNQYAVNVSDYFNNTTTSSIAYSRKLGKKFNLTANLGESYNINTGSINLDLPSITLSSSQFYPFRKKQSKGKQSWYENISFTYRTSLVNNINTIDSLLFTQEVFRNMKNGMSHSIPIQSSVKILKHFNWTNSINYNERWYLNSTIKQYNPITDLVDKDTVFGFISNRDVSFNTSLTTRLYGMFAFKKGYIKALRHVINPSLSMNFTPDFSDPSLGFYNFYLDKLGNKVFYSKTEDGMFGSPPRGKSGIVSFNLGNNLEMKVGSKKDSIKNERKIVLLESFNISTGYDLAKDSVNWQPLRITARTTLFQRLVINYSASYTPYVINQSGQLTNEFLYNKEKILFKNQNSQWDLNLNWQLNSKKSNTQTSTDNISPTEQTYSPFANPNEVFGYNVDFTIPWSLNLGLNFSRLSSYIVALANYQTNLSSVLSAKGDINLTNKWKIGFTSGYDFINKDFTYTSIDFYRDLHCWEMRMNWIPFGPRAGWNFTIAVKASMLQDLKYEMRDDFRNRIEY
ncbi:MAG: putative LPS assembly protein LptD [Bacteroidales bacterium]|nr:putative LPS assembly protein LptD [Bacteroidales bacterium]